MNLGRQVLQKSFLLHKFINLLFVLKILWWIKSGGVVGQDTHQKITSGSRFPRNIRIYHECEGRIEKSVSRITIWHHEACRVMTNGDPKGWIFLSCPQRNNRFFSCSPLFFYLFYFKMSFQKSLNMLRCNFT